MSSVLINCVGVKIFFYFHGSAVTQKDAAFKTHPNIWLCALCPISLTFCTLNRFCVYRIFHFSLFLYLLEHFFVLYTDLVFIYIQFSLFFLVFSSRPWQNREEFLSGLIKLNFTLSHLKSSPKFSVSTWMPFLVCGITVKVFAYISDPIWQPWCQISTQFPSTRILLYSKLTMVKWIDINWFILYLINEFGITRTRQNLLKLYLSKE